MADDNAPLKEALRMLALVNERFDALERQMVLLRQTLQSECIQTRAETVAAVGTLRAAVEGHDLFVHMLTQRVSHLEGWDMARMQPSRLSEP